MARGRKTVHFDFEFEYSQGGEFKKAGSVDLQAPNRGLISVQNFMDSWVSQSLIGLASKQEDLKGLLDSVDPDEARQQVEQDDGSGMLETVKMGLSVDEYDRMVNFILKNLTNSPLARVGGTDIRLTPEILDDIEAQGDLEAIMQLVGAFTGFFGVAPRKTAAKKGRKTRSAKQNGIVLSRASV